MKPRGIWKVAKRELVEGWLCVDAKAYSKTIAFFPGKARPFLARKESRGAFAGQWRKRGRGWACTTWCPLKWEEDYGDAPLPKPGKCERVRLEL